jgi:hypothetical protein
MNRFCGMCGTPLPQKPITAPGAQSTLSFTRLPLEVRNASSSTVSNRTKSAAVQEGLTGAPAARSSAPSGTATTSAAKASVAKRQTSSSPAASNYFTQAEEAGSLEQFIAGFRYTPPSDEEEVTMTGDKPVADGSSIQAAEPTVLPEEPALPVDSPAAVSEQPRQEVPYVESKVTEPPPFAMKNARTEAPERSRFLDVDEPATQESPVSEAPIGGPSFLGLSDTPAPYQETEIAAPRSHWRAWLAVIVILIFTGLGYLEWRAEKNQSSNGPMEIMKMQIERLKGKKGAVITPAPSSNTTGESAPSDAQPRPSGAGPDMQVVPGQKPQTNTPDTGNKPGASPEKPGNPGTSSTTASPQTQARPANGPPATENSQAGGATGAGAEAATNGPATTETEGSGKDAQASKITPGADELSKAQNAGDSAAASAWLWKSVAKGNPEAPVKLANMYIKGDGVPQNCEQALVLLRSAAAKENAAANSRLGAMYANATCVPRDRVRAYVYMSSALEANPNSASARDSREQLWTHMTAQERSQAQKYRQ